MLLKELEVQDKILILEELLEPHRTFEVLYESPEQPMVSCIWKISLKITPLVLDSFARSMQKVTVGEHIE